MSEKTPRQADAGEAGSPAAVPDGTGKAADYPVGTRVTFVTFHGPEWKAEVIGHTSLACDLVVSWVPPRPSLHDTGTVCLYHVKEVRVDA